MLIQGSTILDQVSPCLSHQGCEGGTCARRFIIHHLLGLGQTVNPSSLRYLLPPTSPSPSRTPKFIGPPPQASSRCTQYQEFKRLYRAPQLLGRCPHRTLIQADSAAFILRVPPQSFHKFSSKSPTSDQPWSRLDYLRSMCF